MNKPLEATEAPRAKSSWLAALFSLLLPGLGQVYCGQDNKGVFLIGMSLLGQWSTGGLSSLILCPVMAVDAWLTVRKFKGRNVVGRWEFFPGIRPLNSLSTRVMLTAVVLLVAGLTVVHIRQFASDYALSDK